ncbi:hypothetical protein F4806DRAFT_455867 [Annulohypoxylon nitens]|nr:hypothetical protein F4806DRAFT_455867 [Annulohypoxylon nitens]
MAFLFCPGRRRPPKPPPKKPIPYAWIYPPPRAQQRPPVPRHAQSQSLLFDKLPLELRLKIFRLALYCSPIPAFVRGLPRYVGLPHPAAGWPEVTVILEARLLSLLLTCSRAYAEALPILYSINTFSPCSSDTVILLANTSYASWIQRLEFSPWIRSPPIIEKRPKEGWIMRKINRKFILEEKIRHREWLKVWEYMRKFEGLRWLHVNMNGDSTWSRSWREHEMEILMPLRGLLKDEVHGKLTMDWGKPAAQGTAAEDILKEWVVERQVRS